MWLARHARRRPPVLADERRPQELARVARRRLSAAHQSPGGDGRRAVVEVYAVDRSRSILPGIEERAFHSAFVSSTGAAREGSCDGGVPRLRFVGHAETSAEAPDRRLCPKPSVERSRQRPAHLADEGYSRCCPRCKVPISFFPPPTVARSACAASPSRPQSRNPCSASSASPCRNTSSSIANVVQTRRSPELILKGLAGFYPAS